MGSHLHLGRLQRAAVVGLGVLGWVGLAPSPAAAAGHVVCRHGTSGTVLISFGPVHSVVVRRHGDLIEVNGQPCHGATIQNTSAIMVHGSNRRNRFQIDLRGGQFVDDNGHTVRRISFSVDLAQLWDKVSVLGTNGPDAIRFGTLGINLDSEAGSQVDVALTRVERIFVRSGPGDDVVSANGGFGTGHGSGLPGRNTIFGGLGQDLVIGSNLSRPVHRSIHASASAGNPTAYGDNLHGGPHHDTIDALGGKDHLWGEQGDDTLDGGAGSDVCHGGLDDTDTGYSCEVASGIEVFP